MAYYHYQGRNSNGESVEGILEANIAADVVRHLSKKNITPVNIKLLKHSNYKAFLYKLHSCLGFNKVKTQELLIFARQMAVLIGAGVPIITSLKQIATTVHSKSLRRALLAIVADIVSGKSFANALAEHTKIFSQLFISIIEIGENSGKLQQAFEHLTVYLENKILNKRRLSVAMRYPLSVVVAAVGALIVMEIVVIPKFVGIFGRFKVELPWPTRVLMFVSDLFLNYWPVILLAIVIVFFILRYASKISVMRIYWDGLSLKIPVFGDLQRRILLAQFSWSLSIILRSGIPIIRGILLAASAINNAFLRDRIVAMEQDVKRGASFSMAAKNSGFFPAQALQMIAVGEEAGSLDSMMVEIAKYYDGEVDYDMRRINDLMQPFLLLIVGGMVLVLVLGIYLPMWDLVSVVSI